MKLLKNPWFYALLAVIIVAGIIVWMKTTPPKNGQQLTKTTTDPNTGKSLYTYSVYVNGTPTNSFTVDDQGNGINTSNPPTANTTTATT